MEFEAIQKIWDTQTGEIHYLIDQEAMYKNIIHKKNMISRKISKIEIGIILINSVVAMILLADALDDSHYWDFIASGMLMMTVIYVVFFRQRRKKKENTFDRSMLGELDHAIANTTSIIKFNYLMIVGYLIPMFVFCFAKMIDRGAPLEKWLLILGMCLFSFILVKGERKCKLLPARQRLLALKDKLMA